MGETVRSGGHQVFIVFRLMSWLLTLTFIQIFYLQCTRITPRMEIREAQVKEALRSVDVSGHR